MKFLIKKTQAGNSYYYETEKYIYEYFDIFFAAYDRRIVKAERMRIDKNTQKKTYWRAWYKLPDELAIAFDVDNDDFVIKWPPDDVLLLEQFDIWLEENLLNDNKWVDYTDN